MRLVKSADLSSIVSRTALAHSLRDGIRLFVGRGRRYSVKQLANGTGVPDRVIECVMAPVDSEDFRMPAPEYLFSIMRFLGCDFANEVMPSLCHLGAFDLPDDDAFAAPAELVADAAASTAEVADATADGSFDTKDRARLKIVGQRDIARGMALVAMSAAPELRKGKAA